MGIAFYFSYIIKNYGNTIRKLSANPIKVDNLYLDCNSIIYDAVYKMAATTMTQDVSNKIIFNVIQTIKEYLHLLKPTERVMIAFDGVAPVAKLEQQRSRRFKSLYQNSLSRSIHKTTDPDPWNTTAITPGTQFMKMLDESVMKAFSDPQMFNLKQIIISGSNLHGEGEHKIFQYIRENSSFHYNLNTIIYGLDADLIMLSINHLPISPNIYLFRETPEFIKSINSELEPNESYVLDIPELASTIILDMNNGEELSTDQQKNRIYDYIFLCFFLGNDFIPHFPAVNIRTGGVDKMINAYKLTIGDSNLNLTDGKTIFWGNVRKVVQQLATQEEEFIIKEHRSRNNKEKHRLPDTTPEEKFKNFESTPLYDREMEHFINPVKPYWQSRYYRGLFGIKSDSNDEQKRDIAVNYLQGLEWTMKYYTTGCPDWRWRYKYNYPPLLQDLIRFIPLFDTEFVPTKEPNPVSEIVQLCYVLPRPSLNLLPNKLYFELISRYDHWYKGNCDFVWAYCRYFWESHVEMNEIDIDELERFIGDYRHLLT